MSGQVVAGDVLMNGTVTFADPVISDTKRVINGAWSGTLSAVTIVGSKRQESNPRLSLALTAVLSTPDGAAPGLQLTFLNRATNLAIEVSASWSGSPRKITFALEQSAQKGEKQPLFDATFTQNEGVLDPANGLHLAALAALTNLGKAFADPQFPPNSAVMMLFPPPPPPTEDLQIRAILDWVLFHRRRTKQCQPERAAVVIPARRYRLWHGLVADRDFLAKTIAALENSKAFDREGVAFQQVDVVEFAPGVPTLISPADAVRTDWSKVGPGNILRYGAIASGDAAKQEGSLLAEGRLGGVVQAVGSISTPDVPFRTEVLDKIHPDLAVPDLDGIIVLLTLLQITCVTVVGIKPGTIERVRDAVGRGNIAGAITEFGLIEAEVKFTSGTADVQDNSLQPVADKWSTQQLQKDLGLPPLIAWHDGDANVPEVIALSQGRLIQLALPPQIPPSQLPAPELVRIPRPLPDCPVILFVPTSAPIL